MICMWLYYAGRHPFVLHGLGDTRDSSAGYKLEEYKRNWPRELQPLSMCPSMFYS